MLKIYNTLSRELEEFKPIKEGSISFYQCGPTVYSHQHIGNVFSAVKGDFIRRSLLYLGYDVVYVKNITDVGHLVSDEDSGEDKMEKGAKKEGLKPEEIAKKYYDLYVNDLEKLHVMMPDEEPVATKYIEEMAEMVQTLIDKGYAYSTQLAIYFDVSKLDDYTKLSGQKLEENRSGAGHGDVEDSEKRSPFDFAVWMYKAGNHKNALQTWQHEFTGIEQPTLDGFPGWHIECSAMSKALLGLTIDIHMGGREHIPVHHTNEIAQSEAANGVEFVNYWIHHEWLLIDGGKMSKSIGNIYTLDDLAERGFDPLDYRYFLLQAHYRSKQNFTWEALNAAKSARNNLVKKISELTSGKGTVIKEFDDAFRRSLEEDFNLPQALALLWDMLKSDNNDEDKLATAYAFDKVFGLGLKDIKQVESFVTEDIEKLLEERKKARAMKQWEESDKLRDKLREEHGVMVEDTGDGQKITVVS